MESKISKLVTHWWVALLATIVLGVVVLIPAVGRPGLWEPGERQLADRIAPPLSVEREQEELKKRTQQPGTLPGAQQQPKPPEPACRKAPPDDAVARTANTRMMKWGRDNVDDTDAGRKRPFALLGLLTVIATAGIAIRLGRGRAGIVTAVVLISMPLIVLQSRMLTSDIATTCGATLIIYGLLALYRARDVIVAAIRGRFVDSALAFVDFSVGAIALLGGLSIGFVGGGALLGVLVPIGAIAAAGKLGVPFVMDAGKLVYNVALRVGRKQRWAIGRTPLEYAGPGYFAPFLATVAAIILIVLLAQQLYDFTAPYPGINPPARRVGDVAIVPEGCWSSLLGAVWRPEEDLRYAFDSSFEQVAYGTFPWGILGPVAMILLLRDADPKRRLVGALTLAWAGGAWIAAEAFHRKVGITLYAGFPAIAIAIGVWLDGFLARRQRFEEPGPSQGHVLLGLFFTLAVLQFGKDVWSFPDKMTSLLAGTEIVQYPANAKLLFIKMKMWPLALGTIIAGSFTASLVLWRSGDSPFAKRMRDLATKLAVVAIGLSFILGAFWAFAWHGRLSEHLSSKALFETYKDLRKPGDQLVILGELGHAPIAYADAPKKPNAPPGSVDALGYEKAMQRDQIVQALKRDIRVFSIAQSSELCSLHREMGDKPYFVIDDRNSRHLLFSNKLDGATDKNPLREMIVHEEPKKIPWRPKGKVVWDNKIELLGWSMPKTVRRGAPFDVTIYYKILQPVGGNWTSIMHFDGAIRFSGDHKPIQDRCPTSTWQLGDYIIDTHTVIAGGAGHPLGKYDLWIGFFTGTAPNFKNMTVSAAPGDMRDTNDRVKITSVILD